MHDMNDLVARKICLTVIHNELTLDMEIGAQTQEPVRDGPRKVVVREIDINQPARSGHGARNPPGEAVIRQVELLEPLQGHERAIGDLAGEVVPCKEQELESR